MRTIEKCTLHNVERKGEYLYVVEHIDGSEHPFRTKKEIIEAYGLNYGRVNQSLNWSLNHYIVWCKTNNIYIRVRYYTHEDCPDYMLESANCKGGNYYENY